MKILDEDKFEFFLTLPVTIITLIGVITSWTPINPPPHDISIWCTEGVRVLLQGLSFLLGVPSWIVTLFLLYRGYQSSEGKTNE